ncbi:MAG: hypothetical protein MHM6MM_001915 [Cercozoa sp. M6MM]
MSGRHDAVRAAATLVERRAQVAARHKLLGRPPPLRREDGIVTSRGFNVPDEVPKTPWFVSGQGSMQPFSILNDHFKNEESLKRYIKGVRVAGKFAAETREYAGSLAKPGVSLEDIDRKVHEYIVRHGACPAPCNFHGFPKTVGVGLNEMMLHGIPDTRELRDGDIVTLDVSMLIDGFYGDCCTTVPVGNVDEDALKLIRVTKEAVRRGFDQAQVGQPLGDIARAIEPFCEEHGYSVDSAFCGHGVGAAFHSMPFVNHSLRGLEGQDDSWTHFKIFPFMCFTIEPVVLEGYPQYDTWPDGWAAISKDGSWSAQHEEMVLATPDGPLLLTTTE